MSLLTNNSRNFLANWKSIAGLLIAISLVAVPVYGQSLTTGDIAGVVSDPSGAVVPGAMVTLKSLETGSRQSFTTNQSGGYRFTLLRPGRFSVSATKTGFQTSTREVSALVSQVVTADLVLQVGQSTQTIQVTEAASLINPDASNTTAFTPVEMEALPSAGGDITNIAFTAPGVVVNMTGGYGNFTANGLPATSNLFTVNGEIDMDPYTNINESGATNLTLGQNDLAEATIITNAYNAQYGTFSGAQVNYITKSGTNDFHGNAVYYWNGRDLNANDFFNNLYGESRPFSNANQWATSFGGPIKKNKLFFFVNTEGLRFVLPATQPVTIPTPAFANAVLANVAAHQPSELSTYQKMFSLWANAPGAASAQPLANTSSCTGLGLPGFNPALPSVTNPNASQACAERFEASPTALASEWILSARGDYKISDVDTAFFRWRLDHGAQPTRLDPISSNFDAISQQPMYDTQFSETHIFGPRSTNNFGAAFSHYVSQFAQNQQLALGTFPYGIITEGNVPFTGFNEDYEYPQGRNVTQYQFQDDVTFMMGSHELKFGASFRRYDVSDHGFYYNNPAVYFGYNDAGLQNFSQGLAYQYRQTLNPASDVPVALWGMGLYINDDWRVKSNLKITLGLRAERSSNPVCQFNCFANFKTPFSSLASVTSANQANIPYSDDINYGMHQAFPGVDAVDWSPRIGFNWSPGKSAKTVFSGGFGIFYDAIPAGVLDDLLANPPVSVAIRVRPAAGIAPFAPGPTGGAGVWKASANAFSINDTYSQISSTLSNLGSVFAQPSFTSVVGTMHAPMVKEWNFQIQQELTPTLLLTADYVGNHASRLPYTNSWGNAYDEYGLYPGVPGVASAPADSNYGIVTQLQSGAISNYDGLTITLRKQFSKGLTAHFNYTWSHALDEASNGGVSTYGFNSLGESLLLSQLNPNSLAANYGNADYDVRHLISADWVYSPSFRMRSGILNTLLGGWTFAGKAFWHTGTPFSVIDANTALGNYSGSLLGTYVPNAPPVEPNGCGVAAVNTACLNANSFINAGADSFNNFTALSTQTRNQFFGPHYFDMDMNLYKSFTLREGMTFGVGLQAFNVFNHPNFANPDNNLGDATFGQVITMVSAPTSAYGNFLGFDSSPRVVQITGKFVF